MFIKLVKKLPLPHNEGGYIFMGNIREVPDEIGAKWLAAYGPKVYRQVERDGDGFKEVGHGVDDSVVASDVVGADAASPETPKQEAEAAPAQTPEPEAPLTSPEAPSVVEAIPSAEEIAAAETEPPRSGKGRKK